MNAFFARPIEGAWPYLWIDATYLKARQAGRIVSVAVIIAVAVNTDGRREGLGAAVSAVSLAAFYLVEAAQSGGGLPRGPWFAVFASPAALFFASWLLRRDWRGGRRKAAAL